MPHTTSRVVTHQMIIMGSLGVDTALDMDLGWKYPEFDQTQGVHGNGACSLKTFNICD